MASLKVPRPVPSPTEDAESLRKAFEGWGTNEKSIISILAHREAGQRMQIRLAYEELYQQDLIKRLESELSGHFEKAVYRWMFGPAEREAILVYTEVRKANPTPDPRVIIEIACVSSPEELLAVKKFYQSCYKHSLEEDVAVRFTGDIRKLLVALVGTYRYDGGEIDTRLANEEAKTLHDAIDEKAFGHEEVIRILTTRSKAQLNATFNCFKDKYGTTINKSLPADSENEFFLALRATIRSLTSPCKYFEKLLRNAIINHGTDEGTLTRVIVSRAEKDLQEIKEVFFKRNNVPLTHAVAKETSRDYKAFLLALLGN
ncbi:hypothetical protein AAC387_Pa03g1029 [Persea americana]